MWYYFLWNGCEVLRPKLTRILFDVGKADDVDCFTVDGVDDHDGNFDLLLSNAGVFLSVNSAAGAV